MQLYYIVFFVLFYIIAIASENSSYKNKMAILIIAMLVLTWGAGTRGGWPDTGSYAFDFIMAPSLTDTPDGAGPKFYVERVFIHFVGKILGRMHYVVMKYL